MKKILFSVLLCFLFNGIYAQITNSNCDSVNVSVFITPEKNGTSLKVFFPQTNYTSHQIQYKEIRETLWSDIDPYNIQYLSGFGVAHIFNAPPCNKYVARIRANCSEQGKTGSWKLSDTVSIMNCTVPCPKPFIVDTHFYKDSTGLFARETWLNNFGIDHETTVTVISDDNLFKKTLTTKIDTAKIELPNCKKFKTSVQFNCGGVAGISSDSVSSPIACFCTKPQYVLPYTLVYYNGSSNPIVSTGLYFSSDIYYPEYKELLTITSEDGTYKKVVSSDSLMNYNGYFTRLDLPFCKKIKASLQYTCSATQKSDTTNAEFISFGCPPPCQNLTEIKAGVYSNDTVAYVSWGSYSGLKNAKVTVASTDNSFTKTISTIDTIVQVNLAKCKNFKAALQYDCDTVFGKNLSADFSTTGCVANNCRKPYNFQVDRFPNSIDSTLKFSWTNDSTLRYDVAIIINTQDSSYQKTYYTTDNQIKIKFPFCGTFWAKLQYKCAGKYIDAAPSLPFDYYNFCQSNPCYSTNYYTISSRIYSDDTVAIVNWKKYSNKDTVLIRISAIDSSFYYKFFTTDTSFKISLPKCKTFRTLLNYKCDTSLSNTASSSIITGKCDNKCTKPNYFYTNVNGLSVDLGWNDFNSNLNLINNSTFTITSADSSFKKVIRTTDSKISVAVPACTKFTASVQFQCGTQLSDPVTSSFETAGCLLPCSTPYILSARPYQYDTIIAFAWQKYSLAPVDSSILTVISEDGTYNKNFVTADNGLILKLRSCTNYRAILKFKCDTRYSSSDTVFFKTQRCLPNTCSGPNYFTGSYNQYTQKAYFNFGGNNLNNTAVLKIKSDDGSFNQTIIKTDTVGSSIIVPVTACKKYTATMQFQCNESPGYLSDSMTVNFDALPCPVDNSTCAPITKIVPLNLKDSLGIHFIADDIRIQLLQFQYHIAGDASWSPLITSRIPIFWLKNLKPCITYVARARTVCDVAQTILGDWAEYRFKSGTNCLRGDNSGTVSSSKATVSVSPNPGSGNPTVIYKLESAGNVKMDVINLYGSVLETFNAGELPAGAYNYNFTKLENLPAGLYLVRLHTDGEISQSVKWVKE